MARPKDIGTAAETAVVRYLQTHGWPYAERRALAGAQDLGDVTGTPGLAWEVKGGRAAEQASDGLLSDWLAETEVERTHAGADIGVLVTKRSGYGPARAASWWAHLDVRQLARLTQGDAADMPDTAAAAPVRMHLSTAVLLLRAAGYGEPLAQEAAAEVSA